MAFNFDVFRVVEVKNPSKECVQICFADSKSIELKETCLIIFEQQVKYIITEQFNNYKRVKIYIIDDDDPMVIDFYVEEYHLFESFFMSLYNKNI